MHANSENRNEGFSLVEVIIAMALLGVVVISVMTLFFMGRNNVYSGRKMTQAVAIATRVSEDLSGLTRDQVYSAFLITGATTTSNVSMIDGTVNSSIKRATNNISATTEANNPTGILSRWNALIPSTTFQSGLVEVAITPTVPTSTASPITTANFVKLHIVVSWKESTRQRMVVLDTTKSQAF